MIIDLFKTLTSVFDKFEGAKVFQIKNNKLYAQGNYFIVSEFPYSVDGSYLFNEVEFPEVVDDAEFNISIEGASLAIKSEGFMVRYPAQSLSILKEISIPELKELTPLQLSRETISTASRSGLRGATVYFNNGKMYLYNEDFYAIVEIDKTPSFSLTQEDIRLLNGFIGEYRLFTHDKMIYVFNKNITILIPMGKDINIQFPTFGKVGVEFTYHNFKHNSKFVTIIIYESGTIVSTEWCSYGTASGEVLDKFTVRKDIYSKLGLLQGMVKVKSGTHTRLLESENISLMIGVLE